MPKTKTRTFYARTRMLKDADDGLVSEEDEDGKEGNGREGEGKGREAKASERKGRQSEGKGMERY